MKANRENVLFISIAAWHNWKRKTEIFLKSAEKHGIDVELLDKGRRWQGFYYHKISRLSETLRAIRKERPQLEYVVYTDARDVVFIKPLEEILASINKLDLNKVWFNVDKPRTWPFQARWFDDEVAKHYGRDGVVNAGCYVGRIEKVLTLLEECVQLHSQLLDPYFNANAVVSRLVQEMQPRYLQDDQYHLQVLQALGSSTIAVDKERRVFACFDGAFHAIKSAPERGNAGSMPIGDAGILHSPWMLSRSDANLENQTRWRNWAIKEEIV